MHMLKAEFAMRFWTLCLPDEFIVFIHLLTPNIFHSNLLRCFGKESTSTAVSSKFVEESAKLVYGEDSDIIKEGRFAGIQALSGTSACRLFAEFQKLFFPDSRIYLPDPTWSKMRQMVLSSYFILVPITLRFDTAYFKNLVKQRGLLTSDQALFNGGSTDKLVKTYSMNPEAFWDDFAKSMIKMGNIKSLTGKKGQIRVNCRRVN
ncbi:cationic peroxidase 1-like [Durio zibethinus]|uniref:peroxidase n=1 Tax=Durio zibethinus TaxID=66656 RepID=A0A6P6A8W6_DURZI|nr:cationic peroxidase 1-like [Durio zibethinus]